MRTISHEFARRSSPSSSTAAARCWRTTSKPSRTGSTTRPCARRLLQGERVKRTKRSEAKRTSLVTEVCEATNPLLTRRTFFARRSGAGRILADGGEGLAPADPNARAGAGPGANQIYSHLLPHGTKEEAERGAGGRGRATRSTSAPPGRFGTTTTGLITSTSRNRQRRRGRWRGLLLAERVLKATDWLLLLWLLRLKRKTLSLIDLLTP